MIGRAAPGESIRLIRLEEEARLFLRLRISLVWQAVRSMVTGSRLRLSLVIVLSSLFWGALYGLFLEAFTFLDVLHTDVVPLLFNAFFSSLMVMLVFSAGILLYGGLYCSPEARLLLTLPVRAETIFGHKFREAMWFSSWGFVLLGSPMLVAYGVVRDSAWPYYALLLPFMLAFVIIPAGLGGSAACCWSAGCPGCGFICSRPVSRWPAWERSGSAGRSSLNQRPTPCRRPGSSGLFPGCGSRNKSCCQAGGWPAGCSKPPAPIAAADSTEPR